MAIKSVVSAVCVLIVFSGCMMNLRQKKTTQTADSDTTGQVAEPDEYSAKVQYTFLDTINQGNELRLTDDALGDQSDKVESTTANTTASSETRYRVQLLASSRIETVREQKKMVEKKLSEQVLIGYEAPYYKLYAGSFMTRKDAEALLPKIKKLGFPDAWIVTTKIPAEN